MGKRTRTNDMGCGGSKDHTPEPGDEAPTAAADATPTVNASGEEWDKSLDWMSNDLKTLMHDYFNRYDLDGSQTINSSEELKQLCTNLVVKLDLPMDVSDIDEKVASAGPFEDDDKPDGGWPDDQADGKRNEWKQNAFVEWFIKPDMFAVDKDWKAGDVSDEDEEPNESKPFLTGTYQGTIEGGGKKYTIKEKVAGKIKDNKLHDYTLKENTNFKFRIRDGEKGDGSLMERAGCDAVGYYRTSGKIEGSKITMVLEYDIDNDAATKEPKLVLEGEWGGAAAPMQISGTWKNENADDADAASQMAKLGLADVQEGTFTLSKRLRDDE